MHEWCILKIVSVVGSARPSGDEVRKARKLGVLLARAGFTIACGGGGGIMEAVCEGAHESGGLTVGIIPTSDTAFANQFVDIPIITGLGAARNRIVALTGSVVIAVGGRYGTLTEIGYALDAGKPVCSIGGWLQIPGVQEVESPEDAVAFVENYLK